MAYVKISDMTAASALDGTELLEAVQSSASVKVTVNQIHAGPVGVANTTRVGGWYIFDEDSELNFDGSFTDAQASALTTLTGVPSAATAVWAFIRLRDTSTDPILTFKRSSGGTQELYIGHSFAGIGVNAVRGTYWLPTNGNSIYVTQVAADTTIEFKVLGYAL